MLFYVCGPDHSQAPNLSEFKDFDNSKLSVEFQRLGFQEKVSQFLDTGTTQTIEPPNKRLKVDERMLILEEVTADLYEILDSQRITSMDGLHQVAG